MKKIFAIMIFVLALGATGLSQERRVANFVSGNFVSTFASRIGYDQPGLGGGVSGEFRFPSNFALTEDFQVVSERKRELKTGKSVISNTGVQYHFDNGFFARGALEVGKLYDERNGDAVVRVKFGGGYQVLGQSELPIARLTAEYFTPLKDEHGSRGVSVSGDGYYQFSGTPFAVGGKVGVNYARFHEVFNPQFKNSGFYSTFEARFVLNLSSLAGE